MSLHRIASLASVLLTSCLLGAVVHAQATFPLTLDGKIVYVEDGDTLTLLDARNQQHRIRLTDLDAPESAKEKYQKLGQPYSAVSGRNLSSLAKGRQAQAICYEFDNYARLVCRVTVDRVDVSLAQIRAGYAWANGASKRFVRDARAYEYEQEARQQRRGLWRDAAPVAPWIWRRACWGQGQCAGAGE
jgi:endonuclease YncB( thermonuclease family)